MRARRDPFTANLAATDVMGRRRDFHRALPQLRRFASRLLPSTMETEEVISRARDTWEMTQGSFDAPVRHLLRLVAQACIERQREIARAAPGSADEDSAVVAIADAAEVSLLIALNRLPRRAREAFVASVLGRATPSVQADADLVSQEIRSARLHFENLAPTLLLTVVETEESETLDGAEAR